MSTPIAKKAIDPIEPGIKGTKEKYLAFPRSKGISVDTLHIKNTKAEIVKNSDDMFKELFPPSDISSITDLTLNAQVVQPNVVELSTNKGKVSYATEASSSNTEYTSNTEVDAEIKAEDFDFIQNTYHTIKEKCMFVKNLHNVLAYSEELPPQDVFLFY